MSGKQLFPLLTVTAILYTSTLCLSPQSALSMSPKENDRQQQGQEKAPNTYFDDREVLGNWLPRCTVFILGCYFLYGRKKQ